MTLPALLFVVFAFPASGHDAGTIAARTCAAAHAAAEELARNAGGRVVSATCERGPA